MKNLLILLILSILLFSANQHKGLKMVVKSPAFENGGFIPSKYTCDGSDISIPLVFEEVPKSTKSLAIIMDDPDAPMGVFVHWVIYNIPSSIGGLPEGIPNEPILEYGIKQGVNDFGKIGYSGPCPPSGSHRYFIKVYAIDIPLEIKSGITKAQLLGLMSGHVVDEAVLMGVYER